MTQCDKHADLHAWATWPTEHMVQMALYGICWGNFIILCSKFSLNFSRIVFDVKYVDITFKHARFIIKKHLWYVQYKFINRRSWEMRFSCRFKEGFSCSRLNIIGIYTFKIPKERVYFVHNTSHTYCVAFKVHAAAWFVCLW